MAHQTLESKSPQSRKARRQPLRSWVLRTTSFVAEATLAIPLAATPGLAPTLRRETHVAAKFAREGRMRICALFYASAIVACALHVFDLVDFNIAPLKDMVTVAKYDSLLSLFKLLISS